MDECPVVRVKAENEYGSMLINESDYNPDIHGEILPEPEVEAEETPTPSAVDETMFAEEIVELAKKKFSVRLNPDAPIADLVAEFRKLEQGK